MAAEREAAAEVGEVAGEAEAVVVEEVVEVV